MQVCNHIDTHPVLCCAFVRSRRNSNVAFPNPPQWGGNGENSSDWSGNDGTAFKASPGTFLVPVMVSVRGSCTTTYSHGVAEPVHLRIRTKSTGLDVVILTFRDLYLRDYSTLDSRVPFTPQCCQIECQL